MALEIFKIDPSLESHQSQIWDRVKGYRWWKSEIEKNEGGLAKFAEGYKIFGFNKEAGGWRYREWLPNAKQVFLIGEFNDWQNTTPLSAEKFGRWSVFFPDEAGSMKLSHRHQLKVRIETNDGQWIERVPAWTKLAWQDPSTNLFNGVFWEPPSSEQHVIKHARPPTPANLKIYEAHVGMASSEPKVATYTDFAKDVLPRIKRLGYNAVQLMAVAEHAHYGCFGYHVTSFFAPASRSGTPEELKAMVDAAHGMGIVVLMDLVHAHASSNTMDGIAQMDGTDHCYTHGGPKGHHTEWDSKIFHYTKYEVLRYLLSNVKWWIEEFGFDGFRFDGITSMLFNSHGIGKGYTGGYHEYFGPDADIESHIYLMLANDLIHTILPSAITVGEDVSGMPTLCRPVQEGGFGFDYRLAMAIPDMFIKLLEASSDDDWDMGHITHTLTNRRWKEKVVAYAESHDQAIVGDKTLAFWLMDAEMYSGMSEFTSPQPSMCIDRGLALHKMIRMLVLGLGGEGYLNFMGNEFGHPEWIDFPRPENSWSHHHCRRRWDLSEDGMLRYKFFEAFDEAMQACENRFQWLNSAHQFVSVQNNKDKVIAFERGDLLFVFNFHPCNSYTDYQIGLGWKDHMRCVLDSDEQRFGGQCRLEHGHANSFHPLVEGSHGRTSSVKMYLPSRTVQVLAKEKMLEGNVRIYAHKSFLQGVGVKSVSELTAEVEVFQDRNKHTTRKRFDKDGCLVLDSWNSVFTLENQGKTLECKASKDGFFRTYFPGEYTMAGVGYLANGTPEDFDKAVSNSTKTCELKTFEAEPKQANPGLPEKKIKPAAAVPSPVASDPAAECSGQKVQEGHSAGPTVQKIQGGYVPPAAEPTVKPAPDVAGSNVLERTRADMARCYSGTHFVSVEVLDALDKADQEGRPLTRQSSEPAEGVDKRISNYKKAVANFGTEGGLTDIARSYRKFGFQRCSDGSWTFQEWMPGASEVFLAGDFNQWDHTATPLAKLASGAPDVWACKVSGAVAAGITKGSKYKLCVKPIDGNDYWTVPAWSRRYSYNEDTRLFDAVVWPLDAKPTPSTSSTNGTSGRRIYELHLGLVNLNSLHVPFVEGAKTMLPRIAKKGYTDVLLIGALECKEYCSLGKQPLGLFAPARQLGTPEELVAFVSTAHTLGLRVSLSIAHNGVACSPDGLGGQFFTPGEAGFNPATGSRMFNFSSTGVLRLLLSSLHFWMTEYGFDGFRFQGTTEIIYTDRGLWVPTEKEAMDEFLAADDKINNAGVHYLMMANEMIHEIKPQAVTVADEFTNFPLLCQSVLTGGLGFDIRENSGLPKLFRGWLKNVRDEEWSIGELVEVATGPKEMRPSEPVIGCTEMSENCVVARRPLKIAMMSWETLHTVAAGGVAPHVTELAGALHAAGHEVHIFTRSSNGTTWEHPIWGVIYHEVAFQTSPDFVREIENMCEALVGNFLHVEGRVGGFDIVHGHDWLVGPAISRLQGMGRRCVFTMHSTETGRCGNVQFGGQSAAIRSVEGHACHAAERLIAVSGVLKEEVCSHYGVDGRKVEVVYNGIHAGPIVNMEWQDEWSGNTKRDKGFDAMAPMFLFVGRLAVQKGPDLLLDAIPMVLQARGDAKFVFVGDGHMKATLEAEACRRGIGHAVHFAGSVKSGSPHLKALFKSCDAVVVPSRNEPFGIVVLEAWAAGKPVVATTCGGPRDFVTPDRDGYLVDPDAGSIAWGVCKICENFAHAQWMGSQARDKALNEFNWAFIGMKTQEIYYEQMNLSGLPYCRTSGALEGASLAAELLGPNRGSMGVLEDNVFVNRGISMLKQVQLITSSLGSDSVMTWMGSEFGQIDSVELPRPGNNMQGISVDYVSSENEGLKFKHLDLFSLCLNRTEAVLKWLSDPKSTVLSKDEEKKILAYVRGQCVFVYNFHPSDTHTGFVLNVPADAMVQEHKFVIALDTNDARFGGTGHSATAEQVASSARVITLTLPPRTALVLAPSEDVDLLSSEPLMRMGVDDFLRELKDV